MQMNVVQLTSQCLHTASIPSAYRVYKSFSASPVYIVSLCIHLYIALKFCRHSFTATWRQSY